MGRKGWREMFRAWNRSGQEKAIDDEEVALGEEEWVVHRLFNKTGAWGEKERLSIVFVRRQVTTGRWEEIQAYTKRKLNANKEKT